MDVIESSFLPRRDHTLGVEKLSATTMRHRTEELGRTAHWRQHRRIGHGRGKAIWDRAQSWVFYS